MLFNVMCIALLSFGLSHAQTDYWNLPISNESPIQHKNCPTIDDPVHPVLLAYQNDCRKYYRCQNGFAYAYQCPESLFWSQITYRCDHIGLANCAQEVVAGAPPEKPSGSTQTTRPIFYSAYPGDCNRFYETREMYCPANYNWNEIKKRCDLPHLAGCERQPGPMPPYPSVPAAIPTTISDLAQQCKIVSGDYIPYPGDCHKFIMCTTRPTVVTCPADLVWNPELLSCDITSANC